MALGLLKEVAIIQGFPNSSVGKESACNAGETSLVPRRDKLPSPILLGFPDGSAGKESACNVGDLGSLPGLGRYPEEGKGYPRQYSDLENLMDCIVLGLQRVGHDCKWSSHHGQQKSPKCSTWRQSQK